MQYRRFLLVVKARGLIMGKRNKLIAARLTAVLLTLVMITGSFSAFVFADGSADEAAAGK